MKFEDFGLLTTKFISFLVKGDEFVLDGKLVAVTKVIKGWPSYFRQNGDETMNMKVFLIWGEQKITLEYCYGIYAAGIRAKGRRNKSSMKASYFLGQIEANIILDSINSNNPFHEYSFITKRLQNEI